MQRPKSSNCDASRISAGVLFREFAPAGRNDAKHFPNLSTTRLKGPKSFEIPPQTFPKSSPTRPKAIPNPFKRPLGPHLGPMLEKDMLLNVQKSTQMCPKVAKRRPGASQNPSKWSPRPPQIHFLDVLLALISLFHICIDFLAHFHRFLMYFVDAETLKILIFPR